MIFRLFRISAGRLAGVPWSCAILMFVVGCTPSYNWRELVVADGHVRATFPAKVDSETRTITLDSLTLPFTLTMAQVERAVFAVGFAPLPEELQPDREAREAIAQALMRALYKNVGASVPSPLPAFGQEFVARGMVGQQPTWLLARVWVTETLVVEAVATGTDRSLPVVQAEEFVRAVKLNSPD